MSEPEPKESLVTAVLSNEESIIPHPKKGYKEDKCKELGTTSVVTVDGVPFKPDGVKRKDMDISPKNTSKYFSNSDDFLKAYLFPGGKNAAKAYLNLAPPESWLITPGTDQGEWQIFLLYVKTAPCTLIPLYIGKNKNNQKYSLLIVDESSERETSALEPIEDPKLVEQTDIFSILSIISKDKKHRFDWGTLFNLRVMDTLVLDLDTVAVKKEVKVYHKGTEEDKGMRMDTNLAEVFGDMEFLKKLQPRIPLRGISWGFKPLAVRLGGAIGIPAENIRAPIPALDMRCPDKPSEEVARYCGYGKYVPQKAVPWRDGKMAKAESIDEETGLIVEATYVYHPPDDFKVMLSSVTKDVDPARVLVLSGNSKVTKDARALGMGAVRVEEYLSEPFLPFLQMYSTWGYDLAQKLGAAVPVPEAEELPPQKATLPVPEAPLVEDTTEPGPPPEELEDEEEEEEEAQEGGGFLLRDLSAASHELQIPKFTRSKSQKKVRKGKRGIISYANDLHTPAYPLRSSQSLQGGGCGCEAPVPPVIPEQQTGGDSKFSFVRDMTEEPVPLKIPSF